MRLSTIKAFALNAANVRYLVAGGLAVIAHGLLRQTKDADLMVQLGAATSTRCFKHSMASVTGPSCR